MRLTFHNPVPPKTFPPPGAVHSSLGIEVSLEFDFPGLSWLGIGKRCGEIILRSRAPLPPPNPNPRHDGFIHDYLAKHVGSDAFTSEFEAVASEGFGLIREVVMYLCKRLLFAASPRQKKRGSMSVSLVHFANRC